MTRLLPVISALAILGAAGCADNFGLQDPDLQTDESGNVEIIVSNQSFAIDAVDIHVRIDGRLAISDVFEVGSQHTFVPHTFNITPGTYEVTIESNAGDATLTETIDVEFSKRWATIMYWYYPDDTGGVERTPPQFSYDQSDEQPLFD